MNGPSYFEIQADDVDRAMTFYREVFGWNFKKAEGLPIEYWRIETDGPQGGMLEASRCSSTSNVRHERIRVLDGSG